MCFGPCRVVVRKQYMQVNELASAKPLGSGLSLRSEPNCSCDIGMRFALQGAMRRLSLQLHFEHAVEIGVMCFQFIQQLLSPKGSSYIP